ncbi:hypothetical protein RM533_13205 [Croceicoccus sp. F390]|uniref:Uncharacterized protein n=1 Tax=Croceicoccus esteveae TaxID=3075597 RepID=A0ABU2ZNH6_9SPHN|nr:hypothetical protein [Croceicoccus sp. F390]MDT0577124.1 hypothetical protein [Croceicoccus sp. F390]
MNVTNLLAGWSANRFGAQPIVLLGIRSAALRQAAAGYAASKSLMVAAMVRDPVALRAGWRHRQDR